MIVEESWQVVNEKWNLPIKKGFMLKKFTGKNLIFLKK